MFTDLVYLLDAESLSFSIEHCSSKLHVIIERELLNESFCNRDWINACSSSRNVCRITFYFCCTPSTMEFVERRKITWFWGTFAPCFINLLHNAGLKSLHIRDTCGILCQLKINEWLASSYLLKYDCNTCIYLVLLHHPCYALSIEQRIKCKQVLGNFRTKSSSVCAFS